MTDAEMIQVIASLPPFVRSYVLARFALAHAEEFEVYYLDGMMKNAD